MLAVNGGTFTDGSDNVVDLVLTGVASLNQSAATIHRSDFTRYRTPIDGEFAPGALTCNWWGFATGPVNVPANVAQNVYTQWAIAAVANGAGGACTGEP